MAKKERLDNILLEKGYFETKSKAQAAIMSGDVKVNGETITKAGYQLFLDENTQIEIKTMPFVSRGGFKLAKAIKVFNINIIDKICLDAGASTGGFTDCMLQNGAKKVYAVDVGYGQIAWKLRQDERVKVIERVNIKNCSKDEIYDKDEMSKLPSFCAMDLSFISITKVIENVINLLNNNFEIVALIKPQFEAGKEQIGKNGVVKDKYVHYDVINNIIKYVHENNLKVKNLEFSPIKGPAGNIEYLIHLTSNMEFIEIYDINNVIENSFKELN